MDMANRRAKGGGSPGKKAARAAVSVSQGLLAQVLGLQFLPVGIGLQLAEAFVDEGAQFLVALADGRAELVGLTVHAGLLHGLAAGDGVTGGQESMRAASIRPLTRSSTASGQDS